MIYDSKMTVLAVVLSAAFGCAVTETGTPGLDDPSQPLPLDELESVRLPDSPGSESIAVNVDLVDDENEFGDVVWTRISDGEQYVATFENGQWNTVVEFFPDQPDLRITAQSDSGWRIADVRYDEGSKRMRTSPVPCVVWSQRAIDETGDLDIESNCDRTVTVTIDPRLSDGQMVSTSIEPGAVKAIPVSGSGSGVLERAFWVLSLSDDESVSVLSVFEN